MKQWIKVAGAREHNLKDVHVKIPRDELTVVTGLSGSGKSSLAFDTIYAEGQRKYVESLSAYARQFLGQMQKPDVDYIEGLSPAVSIEQRTAGANPRSIVATTTEIYDYLRLLFASIGKAHCYKCGKPVTSQSAEEIVEQLMQLPAKTKLMVLAPLVRGRKGEHVEVFEKIRKEGFVRARVDGEIHEIENVPKLKKTYKHTIEAVVDRLAISDDIRGRMTDSVELALAEGEGLITALIADENGNWDERPFSEQYACIDCGISFDKLESRHFSFNSP
ncbi:MAG: excinuclease ABC subunit UvrA, partial [Verrucomicrobiota bacterium]